jgi:hypothetical protein
MYGIEVRIAPNETNESKAAIYFTFFICHLLLRVDGLCFYTTGIVESNSLLSNSLLCIYAY